MQVNTAYKFGKHTPQSWAGVYGYRPERTGTLRVFGEMFAVMSIRSKIDFDLQSIGGWMFDELQANYFADGIVDVNMDHFEKALKSLRHRLEAILDREQALAKEGLDLEIAVVVLREANLYAGVIGEAKIFVSRGTDIGEIGAALIDPDLDGFMRTGSMLVESEDRVLLATSTVATENSTTKLQQQLTAFTLDEVATGSGASLLIGYGVEVPEELEPLVVPHQDLNQTPAQNLDKERETQPVELEDVVAEQEDADGEATLAADTDDVFAEVDAEYETDVLKDEFGDATPIATSAPAAVPAAVAVSTAEKLQTHLTSARKRGVELGKAAAVRGRALIEDVRQRIAERKGKSAQNLPVDTFDADNLTTPTAASAATTETPSRLRSLQWQSEGVVGKARDLFARAGHEAQRLFTLYVLRRGDRHQLYQLQKSGGERWRYLFLVAVAIGAVVILGIRQKVIDGQIQAAIEQIDQDITDVRVRVEALDIDVAAAQNTTQVETRQDTFAALEKLAGEAEELRDREHITPDQLEDIDGIEGGIETRQDLVLKVTAITEPQVITDLGANFEGAEPSDIQFTDGSIFVSDAKRDTIYKMGTALGSQATDFVSGLTQPYMLIKDTGGDLVVLDRADSSVVARVDVQSGEITRQPGLSDSSVGNLAAADIWTNKAMYAINPLQDALVRMSETGGNFELPNYGSPWRKDTQFANAVDMDVDFRVIVLIKTEGIKSYLSGNPEQFEYRGLLPTDREALRNANAFEVAERFIYVADSANQRILVFARDVQQAKFLEFRGQIAYRGTDNVLGNVKDLVVNNDQLYVLDGTKVLRIAL